jgi:hypothetical protein
VQGSAQCSSAISFPIAISHAVALEVGNEVVRTSSRGVGGAVDKGRSPSTTRSGVSTPQRVDGTCSGRSDSSRPIPHHVPIAIDQISDVSERFVAQAAKKTAGLPQGEKSAIQQYRLRSNPPGSRL